MALLVRGSASNTGASHIAVINQFWFIWVPNPTKAELPNPAEKGNH
jgi:hypothetical protein